MQNFNVENACHAIASAAVQKLFSDFDPYGPNLLKTASEAAHLYAETYKHTSQEFSEMALKNRT